MEHKFPTIFLITLLLVSAAAIFLISSSIQDSSASKSLKEKIKDKAERQSDKIEEGGEDTQDIIKKGIESLGK